MKIRLAKKIMKADTYADYPSKHPLPYWKAKFKEAYDEYGCVTFSTEKIGVTDCNTENVKRKVEFFNKESKKLGIKEELLLQ